MNIGIFVPRTEWKEWSLLYVMDALPILPPPHCINCANANDIMYAKVVLFHSSITMNVYVYMYMILK